MLKTRGNAVQIIAGPGSGKTTELVAQIAASLTDNANQDKSVIACTFTRKAAEELVQKLEQKVGSAVLNSGRLLVGTIHSISLRLLRDFRPEDYLDWEVIAEESQVPYVHSKLMMFGFNESEVRGQPSWDVAREISRIFTVITDENIKPEEVLKKIRDSTHSLDQEAKVLLERIIENYDLYLDSLTEDGFFDYATIQRCLLDTLKLDKQVAKDIVRQYQIIYVDEYQDVNDIQNEIFGELCRHGAKLVVVGDDDQSIYGFRGGKVEHLVKFREYMNTLGVEIKVKRLETNYRSTKQIVSDTTEFINSQSYKRLTKNLEASRVASGPNVRIIQFDSDISEADQIVSEISDLRRSNTITSFRSVGILCTSVKNHSMALQHAFREAKIPLQSFGSGDLLRTGFMYEFMCLLDFWLSKDEHQIDREAKLIESLGEQIGDEGLVITYLKNVNLLITNKNYYGSCLALMYDLFTATDFIKRNDDHGVNVGTLTTLVYNFDTHAKRYDPYGLYSYLIFLRKQADIDYVEDENRDAVQLLTIHRSKGLQFDVVYVISQNERNKPNPTLFDSFSMIAERPNRDADEVQRVLYVAMTRARNHLTITGSRSLEGRQKTYSWNSAVKKAIDSGVGAGISGANTLVPADYTDIATQKDLQPVLSYNAVRLYEICPLQYRFANFDRLETVRIGGMQFGVNMHRVIEQLLRMTKKGLVPVSTDVATLVDKYWRDLPTRPNDENVMFREAGKKQLILFLENFIKTVKPTELAGIEESFSMSIADTRITGRFDLRLFRNGASQIVDFKTGDEADYSGQLSFYAACLREMSGTTPSGVGIYYLKSGKFKMLAPTNLDAQIERVKSVAEQIKIRNFAPNPGKHCSDCAFTSICEFSTTKKKHLKAKF